MSDEVRIGGSPYSCGYCWDSVRRIWHRPWDPNSDVVRGDEDHWFNKFIPEEDSDEAERR